MFGTEPPLHPLAGFVYLVVPLAGAVLLAGALLARRWRGRGALWVRSGAILLALGVPIIYEVLAPAARTHFLEAPVRVWVLWPLVALDAVFFAIWVWRARLPKS
jgi:hypothetical protein